MTQQFSKTEVKVPSISGRRVGGGGNRFAPTQKAKNARGTLVRIIKIYMRFAKTIFLAMIFTAFSSAISVGIPYFVGKTFDTFRIATRTVDKSTLILFLIIIAVLYGVNCLISWINGVIMLKVSQKLVFVIRAEFFEKMQRLPLKFYDTRSHGDTMSRITNDVDNISSTIAQTTTQLISSILTLVGSFMVMIVLNVPLTLVVLLCIPLVILLTRVIATHSRKYFLAQQRNLGSLNGVIEENILGLKMVKAFNKQEDVLKQFEEINENLYESSNKAQIWSGYMMPLMNVINNFIFAVVAIVGGMLSVGYGVAVGTVVSFLSYSKQFSQPLNSVAGMFNTIQSALAGAERVFEILDNEEESEDFKDAIEIKQPNGDVTFENVYFSYDKSIPILKNVSFKVKAGETVALVGETGAGKTTIVNLLTRFYDADSGNIFIDDEPITNIKRNSLRKCFSVVLQDTCLFTGTIMDNIRYSKKDATDEQVVNAAKIAHAHEFIDKLPKGYQTLVSGATDNLSQGQRQLMSIARAVLCDSPILILDEATSSVDTKTEKDIQHALLRLMKNRTSFLIAHRLSTIRDADRIMVIGGGKILESGNHKSLMNEKGEYYKMVISQMGKLIEE
ncbi:ABC transporter ATP-binding protein [Clostridium beijerinckii]|jgi:ABC-type multidrug transport system, ATPase and permease components|uniref:ABC transporter ATP-binding protein n=2 Tax=Clostridium beijerinckii TaxID=1520 RepID=A0AAE2V1S3_CLOBE|nr:ABC transporter ATP-binding protein [Clostridium beijerinckii]ABR35435.1 ABC transporter related [Clostridium beijerinckii NCIMB 8052]AIU01685.1 ABC transporter related protein [Clostridium beijerinckii ATCC 35702]MBF7809922.1 ABC transporter ATP-binding protein [Clostridium beijerinckii]NRT69283.1 ATP-binding cassette subfamily B protein [Clostridium beijerinckii]NRT84569.1 ATP-binding cassette subfamily B protein [Clostridium beijerinckii]